MNKIFFHSFIFWGQTGIQVYSKKFYSFYISFYQFFLKLNTSMKMNSF